MTFRRVMTTAVAAALLSVPAIGLAASKSAGPPSDDFLAGYAAAVLERELSIKADGLAVAGGHVELWHPPLSNAEKAQVVKVLTSIDGVKDVTIHDGADTTTPAAKPIERLSVDKNAAAPATQQSSAADDSDRTLIRTDDTPLTLYLGVGRTFAPLLADPRWPHFFASYRFYDRDTGSTDLRNVAAVGFGETISLIKQSYASGFRWEAGIQAGLFAIFDMDSDSKDLLDADYGVGPYFAARQGDFSLLARVHHQSTHLGDEYLLRSDAEPRQNYSYEDIDLTLSYDLPKGFRVYGGAGYLVDVDPADTRPWVFQYGAEWTSPQTLPGIAWLRPLAAVDFQNRENNDYALSYSVRAGVQIEDPARFTQRLQIMLEYYDGNSPDGQFYDDHVRFFGIGAHFYF